MTDPVFGNDIGFYMFDLDAWWVILNTLVWCMLFGIVASVARAWMAYVRNDEEPGPRRVSGVIGKLATPYTLALIGALGIVGSIEFWFRRYDLLIKDNEGSKVFTGAEAIDVTGFFSTRNDFLLTAIIELGITGVVIYGLYKLRQATRSGASFNWKPAVRTTGIAVVALLALDFGIKAGVTIRDEFLIQPNEPVIQLEYLQLHVDSTLEAYGLSDVETIAFEPGVTGAPLPDVDEMLLSSTLQNGPLWPGFNSEMEQVLDPQHTERLLPTGGDPTIYGPTMDTFRQEQQLRPYYDFLSVDTVAYEVDGETRLFASAVRETPVDPYAPRPWLLHWSQQHLIYTHGYGLVMVPVSGVDADVGPNYASSQIPGETTTPALALDSPYVYFGEGNEAMAFTNASDQLELNVMDGSESVVDPGMSANVEAGVLVDSFLKRLVFGWRSGFPMPVIFSDLINDESQALYYRIPIERVEQIAPIIYFDTNTYAVAADGEMVWMISGMTTSDRYPFSRLGDLGDKSDVRSPIVRPHRDVNYVEDSVKATVNATTGDVQIYKIADEPVVDMWADIYPDLFVDGEAMLESVRAQVQYSPRLYHMQFDDMYWQYHMGDALDFYNADDIWDDGDEVLGPVLAQGESLSFSIEPYYWMAETGGVFPGAEGGSQFVMSQVFTPESAINLQAMATVYMGDDEYGRLVVLEVPRGVFVPGPEQADAAIDQQPDISEQIS
ncbi:MAG: UPF0182 family protein [Chloroflexota bacterium]|nr:UPF0182 family protein [Chloroflexota bacterium]